MLTIKNIREPPGRGATTGKGSQQEAKDLADFVDIENFSPPPPASNPADASDQALAVSPDGGAVPGPVTPLTLSVPIEISPPLNGFDAAPSTKRKAIRWNSSPRNMPPSKGRTTKPAGPLRTSIRLSSDVEDPGDALANGSNKRRRGRYEAWKLRHAVGVVGEDRCGNGHSPGAAGR